MSFSEAVTTCLLRKYFEFEGRAGRPEFWWFFLFVLIMHAVGSAFPEIVRALVALGLLLPSLGAGARRLHDTGRSAWWLLLGIVPIVGLILLYFFAQPGSGDTNQYGAPPSATLPAQGS